MAPSPCILLSLALIILTASTAQSVVSTADPSYANTTSFSSGTVTSSPSQITSPASLNTSCSSCVIAVDDAGLQQIFWFSQTWSVTLDTKYVTVTAFNGSNATATTNTRTVLGDLQSLDPGNIPYIFSLMATVENQVGYFNPNPTLVRGTNGSVGTTSFPYGQPFAMVTAINYRYILPNPSCPLNMGVIEDSCQCLMNSWFPAHVPVYSMNTTVYTLDRTYYQPLPSSVINEGIAHVADDIDSLELWDGEKFKAWLAEDENFKSAFPNWEDCAFWNRAAGPPAAKLPVAVLTATMSTTVHITAPKSSPTAQPASQPTPPNPKPTTHVFQPPAHVTTAQSSAIQGGSGLGGDSSGSKSGEAGPVGSYVSSGSGDSTNPVSQRPQGARESPVVSKSSGPGAIGNGGHSGQESGGLSGGDNGSGKQAGGETGSSSLASSYGSGSGSGFSGSDTSPPTVPFVVTAGDHTVSGTLHGSTAAVIAGNTILAGGPPSSADGALISVHSGASSIAVNGESQPLPTRKPAPAAALISPIAAVGSHTITASPGASEVYYAGTTLSQNGPHATIDNKDIYVGPSGLVIGGSSTVAIPAASSSESSSEGESGAKTFTAAGHTFTSSPSGIAVAGITIQSGSMAVISGTTVSYGSNGLAIGTSIVPVPTPPPSPDGSGSFPGDSPTHVFTIGGQTLTANPTGVYIAGTTLTAGGSAVTISGTAISLGSSGIVIGSSTYAVPSGALPSSTMVVGSETFTIWPTAIEVGGTTLREGGSPITIHGTPISLGPSGLIVAGSTIPFRNGPLTAASQTSEGLGGIILAGFGPSSTTASATGTGMNTSTPSVVGFQGGAARLAPWEAISILGSLLAGSWLAYINIS